MFVKANQVYIASCFGLTVYVAFVLDKRKPSRFIFSIQMDFEHSLRFVVSVWSIFIRRKFWSKSRLRIFAMLLNTYFPSLWFSICFFVLRARLLNTVTCRKITEFETPSTISSSSSVSYSAADFTPCRISPIFIVWFVKAIYIEETSAYASSHDSGISLPRSRCEYLPISYLCLCLISFNAILADDFKFASVFVRWAARRIPFRGAFSCSWCK